MLQRLDEVQSYVLLRRWQSDYKEEAAASQLSAAHLESIMEYYGLERSYAAESLKLLIQLSQRMTRSQDSNQSYDLAELHEDQTSHLFCLA